jgi:hypothetical protein
MQRHSGLPNWLGALLIALIAGCAPQPAAMNAAALAPSLAPDMARVWFLRQADPGPETSMPLRQ